MLAEIWKFETKNFTIKMTAEPEHDPDFSWDGAEEAMARCNSGEWVNFCACCRVYYKGVEIAADYLGDCIYQDFRDFRDHIGTSGTYFSDMVRQACKEARNHLANAPKMRAVI